MEIITIAAIVIGVIFISIYFKKPIRSIANYSNSYIQAGLAEGQIELIEQAMQAKEELIERCGENFETPEEILAWMQKKRKKNVANNQ